MRSGIEKIPESTSLSGKRALVAERLRKAATEPRQAPLSFAQQRLWFLDQLAPNSPLYNIAALARLEGSINIRLLQQSLGAVIARHETLRTRFVCPDGIPVQVIDPPRSYQLGLVDLTYLPGTKQQVEIKQRIQAEINRPFDLTSDHPLRASLIQLGPDEHQLILVVHHIAADEWSLKILFKEWAELYTAGLEGRHLLLPALPVQYSDFARWQRDWLQGDALKEHLEYWKSHLRAFPPVTELLTDYPRPAVANFNGRTVNLALGLSLTKQLKELARKQEATLFMVLLAAFKALVHRYTQQEDLIVCSPVAGRSRIEAEGLIGFFVNTLPLRTSLAGNPSFKQLLARVKKATLGAMAHQDLPFDRLVAELHPERTLAHLPFTKLMFAFQSMTQENFDFGDARIQFLDVEPDLAKFELTLTLRETKQGLLVVAEFNCDLFDTATITRFLGHFEKLLQGAVEAPSTPVSQLPLLSAHERRQLLVECNQNETVYPRNHRIHELFEAQVRCAPHAIAMSWGRIKMTYGELNSRANQLAHFLRQFSIQRDMPVALCVDRSLEMLVGMLAILKAKGAYVPIDSSYPKERLAFMLEDTGAPVLLTQERLLGRLPRSSAKVVCLDADWDLIARQKTENPANPGHDSDLAYIMYTSGSTGLPKGVAVPHRAVNRLVLNTNYIQLGSRDRIAQVSNISFDAATFELWGALLNGGQIVGINRDVALSPKEFANELKERGITAMFLTTALFNQLAGEVPGAFETVRTLIIGGEALDPKWVREVLRNRPPKRMVNGYGPTENTTFTCCHLIRELSEHAALVPLGKPISNTTVFLLDSHQQPVPIGVPGELYAGGDGLARGYWNRPDLTSEKFVRNPFDESGTTFLYRTGDMARRLSDGTVEFLGRIDGQIKIRGHRVELGEIETQLTAHPSIRECVVVVTGASSSSKRLVAYLVPEDGVGPNASQLRAYLAEKLPDYMIPSAFVNLKALPLTPNGKVDRKALPAPEPTRPSLDRRYIAPQDAIERQLVVIWQTVLGVQPVGIQDKFFDLGGHSMLAVRVISQIEKAFGRKLRLATLFQAGTIQRLAAVLRQEIDETTPAGGTSLVEVQSAGSRPPLFLVHGAGGGMFWGYVNLSRQLGVEQPVYGFKSPGLAGHQESGSLQDMAARYLADLRVVQPQGPYYLGGYCFGGNVAYEMACQLTEQGHEVAMLALLNCAPPNSGYEKIPWTPAWAIRFARNLLHWIRYFASWSSNQRRGFFHWKWQLLKRRFALKHGSAGQLPKVEPGDLVDLSSYTEEQKGIWEQHIRALMGFRPRPYRGRVHLFRSAGHPLWCSFDHDYGWGRLARGGVELILVPGAHEKILEDPWVGVLAQELCNVLRTTHNKRFSKTLQAEPGQADSSGELAPNNQISVNGQNAAASASPKTGDMVHALDEGAGSTGEAVALRPLPSDEQTGLAASQEASPESHSNDLEFWRQQLAGAPEVLDLPADRPRPAQGDYAGECVSFALESELTEHIVNFATNDRDRIFDVLLSTFSALLHRYTGSQDIVIGVPVSLRAAADTNRVTNLENTLALRCRLPGDITFRQLIQSVRSVREEAIAHAKLPFATVLKEVRPQVSCSYTPIFQTLFAFEEEPLPESEAGGVRFSPFEIDTQTSKFDLTLSLTKQGAAILGKLHFNTAIFERARIDRFADHFQELLRSALKHADQAISKLNFLPEHERKRLLIEWTATECDYPKDKTLVDLFRERVHQNPEAEALICGNVRLTYSQLFSNAVKLANRLKPLAVKNGALVGICFDRSPEMVVAMLGTLLAGAAYVPLDPKYPSDRLRFTLEDAKIKVLLTQTRLLSLFSAANCPVERLDSLDSLAAESDELTERCVPSPTDLAYVIYTSGSTGKPKGVALEHRNTVALVSWAAHSFSAEELSGVLASTSICFDLSVFELFVPLCCGGKVILVDNALALWGLANASEVRLINTVPSAIRELLRLKAVPSGVQVVNLAGEPLSCELVDQIYQETSVQKVFDLYGPTETTTYSTGVLRRKGERATIGRPLPNEQIYLLDGNLQPVPIGVPGEILIGGDGVARGYLDRPELTSQKFIAHPFKPSGRLYRTGDLGRWRDDGNLEYLGRLDHQVKIRGYRVELGEVEAVLKGDPRVTAAVVIAREDNPCDKRLVAYIETRFGAEIPLKDLKRRFGQQLPDFMTPSSFVFLKALPMTPNGKVDRKALPAPEHPSSNLVELRDPVEAQLLTIWRNVLHLTRIGVQDDFFELGGHSLTAVRVISGIRDTFGIDLPLSALFSAPTIAQLASQLSRLSSEENNLRTAPIETIPRTDKVPVSFVQERLWFLDQLTPGTAAYNVPAAVRLKGSLEIELLREAVTQICSRHEALRASLFYKDGRLTQNLAKRLRLDIPCIDLPNHSSSERELKTQELVNQHARRPFDLASGPLIRVTVFRLEPQDHVLLVVLHHTVSDGWSLGLFFEELAALYEAAVAHRSAKLPTLAIQYSDFAHWQRQWMTGSVLDSELAYWKGTLEGAPAETSLPVDHPRPERPTGRAGRRAALLRSETVRRVTDFAHREGCTPFMFFLAGLLITLRKWTGQEDLVVGTVVAGRNRSEVENLIGCFMNFLPLRIRVPDSQNGVELLGEVRTVVLDGQTHQACPFEKIVAAAHPQRRHDQNPLYNVGLLLQNFPQNLFQTETLQSTSMPVSLEEALLDLRFEIEQNGDGLALICEYKTDLFEPATVEHLLASWLQVNETLVSSPNKRIGEFELVAQLPSNHKTEISDPIRPKIIISSTFTAEPIGDSVQHWLEKLNLPATLEFAPFNQVFQQLLDPASLLGRNQHGLNVILARLEDWQSRGNESNSEPKNSETDLERCLGEFLSAVKSAVGHSSVPLVICICPPRPATADSARFEYLSRTQHRLEQELAGITGVYVLTAAELARWYPVVDYYDPASEELGHVPYTPLFFTALGTAVVRKFHALNRTGYKVIALDCDNTLWSGVCGEDGPMGVYLDAPRRALQEFMRTQRESGMLLCLCSKNSEEDVRGVFSQHADFPLKSDHFTASRLNWKSKSDNLKSLAAELGVGLDTFIFVDDNPVECAEVEANCPGTLALQLPEDPQLVPQFLNHSWVFDHLRLTAEDRQRAELYQQNQLREKLRAKAPTLEQFLASLELKVQIQPIEKADGARVAQLTQRTNQFNFTTRRMTEQELAHWLDSAQGLAVRVSDRFGDYGLVGVVLYRVESEAVVVNNALLSCRVLGRGIEHRVLAHLGKVAQQRNVRWVDVHFVPTTKNQPALNFLETVARDFGQPLNGGSVFKLPADIAAAVAFHPSGETSPRKEFQQDHEVNGKSRLISAGFTGGASRCRDIALNSNDITKILSELGTNARLRSCAQRNLVSPRNDLQRQLCILWQELLHVEAVGVRDDFFELGGHSLLAVRLFAEVQRITGRKLPLVTLFQAPTIEHLSRILSEPDSADSLLVPIQPRGDKTPLFLVHGAGGDVLWGYANLAMHLPGDQPIYGIKSRTEGETQNRLELEEMARDYLQAVRTRQRHGPYLLGGYCFGGNVAYEMARQLRLQGEEVALVVLIDTAPANAGYEGVTWWRPGFAWRFARNARFWLEDFLVLPWEDRRNFAARKLRWIGRKLIHRFGFGVGKGHFDLEEVIDPRKFPGHELKLWQHHLEALIAHVERPYAGRVALLRTRGQPLFCSLEDDFCWGKLVKEGVVVRQIPGSHENIFIGHNVEILAVELTKLLVANQGLVDVRPTEAQESKAQEPVLPL